MFQFRKRTQDIPPGGAGASVEEEPSALRPEPGPTLLGRAEAEDGSDPAARGTQPAAARGGADDTTAGDPATQGPARPAGSADPDLLGDQARRMNLVGGEALAASVEQAVRRALAKHLPSVGTDIAGEVARSTRGALMVMLKARSKKVRGLPKAHFLKEVEASKRKIVAEREAARRELEALLEELGKKHVEFRQSRETLVRETFDKGLVQDQELSEIIYQALGGANAPAPMRQLQRRLTGMVLESLQRERQRAVDEKTSEHSEELRRYELRIAKLTQSLELTEEELKRIAAMKNVDAGVASIYRTVQGLSADDSSAEVKKEMLAGIFQANLVLQKQRVAATAG